MRNRGLWVVSSVAVLVLLITSLAAGPAATQQHRRPDPPPNGQEPKRAPAAHPDDVRSMDSTLAALYDVISGPAGQKRDWDRLRALFVPDGRLITVGHNPANEIVTQSFSLDEFIARATAVVEREGFYEREVHRHVDAFSHIAQVFSTYESRHAPDEQPFARGINSIQMLNDGQRWWLVTIYWEPETPGHRIPKKFRP